LGFSLLNHPAIEFIGVSHLLQESAIWGSQVAASPSKTQSPQLAAMCHSDQPSETCEVSWAPGKNERKTIGKSGDLSKKHGDFQWDLQLIYSLVNRTPLTFGFMILNSYN